MIRPFSAMQKQQDSAEESFTLTPTRLVLRKLGKSRGAIIGGVILLCLVVLTVLAPVISHYDPIKISPTESLQPPQQNHLMGTDDFGRDIATRVLYGARLSLIVGIIAVGIGGLIGTIIGLFAGYYGGSFDMVVSRVIEIMMAFPGILLALIIMTLLGPSLLNVMIAVGVSDIPLYVRLVRGCVISAKENEYIEASRAVGCSHLFILFRHILPNVVAPVIIVSTLEVANAILVAAALSFLGMGAQPPSPEWGAMLNEGRRHIRTAWWMITFPGLMIMLSVLAINLLGDGLRDALDPRLKT